MKNKSFYRTVFFDLQKSIFLPFCILLLLAFQCKESVKQDSFRFVFMTDMHVMPELRADQGFLQAIETVNGLHPDFVITGGDLVKDALGEPYERSSQLFHLYDSLCTFFGMPVYNTMGNHDVFGWYEKSGVSPDDSLYGKDLYLRCMDQDKTYYSFDFKGWHFMLLDGIALREDREYFGHIDSTQIDWIQEDLERVNAETPIVISTHIPFVSVWKQIENGGTAAIPAYLVIDNSQDVLGLFEGHNLKLVLQGHLHIVEDIGYKNVRFITGGAVSGSWWNGSFQGFPEGFVVVDVNGDQFTWHYKTYGWNADRD